MSGVHKADQRCFGHSCACIEPAFGQRDALMPLSRHILPYALYGVKRNSNLSIVMLVSEAKGHFPRRLIISSCFDGVWLACNAGAHCALGKAYLKEDMLFFFLSVLV